MLQGREFLCILLLAAALLPEGCLYAQNEVSSQPESHVERLGGDLVEPELELDLTVPKSEEQAAKDAVAQESPSQQQLIERHLDAARAAMREGRIDQPVKDCAWTHYRTVMDIDPSNAEAQQGLLAVQEILVSRAIAAASDLDFELAERTLEDAALVRLPRDLIDAAQAEILAFRSQYAGELEVKAVQAMDAGDFAQAERQLIELIAMGGADSTVSQLRRRL